MGDTAGRNNGGGGCLKTILIMGGVVMGLFVLLSVLGSLSDDSSGTDEPRETMAERCDDVFAEVLIDASLESGVGLDYWAEATDAEKTNVILKLSESTPGSRGAFIYECYQDGWRGYKE